VVPAVGWTKGACGQHARDDQGRLAVETGGERSGDRTAAATCQSAEPHCSPDPLAGEHGTVGVVAPPSGIPARAFVGDVCFLNGRVMLAMPALLRPVPSSVQWESACNLSRPERAAAAVLPFYSDARGEESFS
jgi:hypothetical protein